MLKLLYKAIQQVVTYVHTGNAESEKVLDTEACLIPKADLRSRLLSNLHYHEEQIDSYSVGQAEVTEQPLSGALWRWDGIFDSCGPTHCGPYFYYIHLILEFVSLSFFFFLSSSSTVQQ